MSTTCLACFRLGHGLVIGGLNIVNQRIQRD